MSMLRWWMWAAATALLALAFSATGLGDPLRSLAAAVWLVLVPALSTAQRFPPPEVIRSQLPALYVSSAVVLALAGTVTLWLWAGLPGGLSAGLSAGPPGGFVPGLRPDEGMPVAGHAGASPLSWHASSLSLIAAVALLTGLGLAVAYLFRGLSVLRGWRETETVRAIMPVTRSERGLFTMLSLAAGFGEEIVFRGFLPVFLMPWFGSYLAAALPAGVAFGILHWYQGPHGMARAGAMGLALAGGVAWTGSLWPSILAHTALNLLFGLLLRRSLLGGLRWT